MIEAKNILGLIVSVADELKLENLRPQIAACQHLLQTHNGIDVAVLGRFKAGKSSFLNHLTGQAVLPIGVVPLTAVITRLRYGPRAKASVRFLHGATTEIPLEQIGQYVSESENPDNTKQVATVDVELPALQSLEPLQFVDTPGLDSAFAHNTVVARDWLPNVGAALVAISADAPLSEHDLMLLAELRRHTPKIVLLLTKADLLTAPQRDEVLTFIQQQLQRQGLADLPIFFYSIQPSLPNLKTKLEAKLLQPLLQHRGEAVQQIVRHKLVSLANQTRDYVRVALAAATQTETARQALQAQLDDERRTLDAFREELHVLAQQWFGQALDWSLAQLQPTQHELQARVTAELPPHFAVWHMRLPGFIQAYNRWLKDFLTREMQQVSHAHQAMFCAPLYKAQQHLDRSLRAFRDRLADRVQTALGLTLSPCAINLEVHEPTAPPVAVGGVFAIPWDLLGNLLPLMTIARPLIQRHLLRQARYEVEKNLWRLAADWRDRVNAEIQHLRQQADTYSRNEVAALEKILTHSQAQSPHWQQIVLELATIHNKLAAETVLHTGDQL